MIGKLRLLFWVGIATIFIPSFGVHSSWKNVITIIIGIATIYISIILRKEYKIIKFKLKRYEQPEVQAEIHTQTQ